MTLIRCQEVSFGYESKIVVENLNFEVKERDYLCIIGENGSGKSTLIKGLLGLKLPISGKIIIDSQLKTKGIGYLPQQSSTHKDFPASVFEVVISGCQKKLGFKPFYRKCDKEIVMENLEKLRIKDLKNKCYSELSGGQQQRVLLARALCATENLLILDEPVTGLDPSATQELYDIINMLNKKQELTVIMVSHDIKSIIKYSSHILHLENKQLFFGKIKEYKNTTLGKKFMGGGQSI